MVSVVRMISLVGALLGYCWGIGLYSHVSWGLGGIAGGGGLVCGSLA